MASRRNFIKTASVVGGTVLFSPRLAAIQKAYKTAEISCQQYPWYTFFLRVGKNWTDNLGYSINQFSKVGFQGLEPSFSTVAEVEQLQPILKQYQLPTHSLYVNSLLHEEDQAPDSIKQVLSIAEAAKALGVKILVTNPSPIRWGGDEDKTDRQLVTQAKALDTLGAKLKTMGLTLAYHNHDAEMRNSAREFHHMMLGTDPENVHLCLDAHWIYRGSGDSQVALFDIAELYVKRIVELHLRQSKDGIWTEEFTEGDIEYPRLAKLLKAHHIKPHLVLEQSIEEKSPETMNAVEAHQLGLTYAQRVFESL